MRRKVHGLMFSDGVTMATGSEERMQVLKNWVISA